MKNVVDLKDIHLEQITEADLEWARQLRNANREYFFDNKIITSMAMHWWFERLKMINSFFIIWYKDLRVGTISVAYDDDKDIPSLGNILIDVPYRKQGILKEAIKIIRRSGFQEENYFLEVKPDNIDAIEAYKHVGFKPVSLRMEI